MSSDDVKAAPEPTDTALPARRPKQRRMRDMALSLAVLLVPLGIFYGVWSWAAQDRQVTVVDTTEDYTAAEALGVEVVRPELSEEWKPVSSALAVDDDSVTLRTGWHSPGGFGMQSAQTTGDADDVHEELAGTGETVVAGGVTWTAYELPEGEAWTAAFESMTVVLIAEHDAVDELPELAEGFAADRLG